MLRRVYVFLLRWRGALANQPRHPLRDFVGFVFHGVMGSYLLHIIYHQSAANSYTTCCFLLLPHLLHFTSSTCHRALWQGLFSMVDCFREREREKPPHTQIFTKNKQIHYHTFDGVYPSLPFEPCLLLI